MPHTHQPSSVKDPKFERGTHFASMDKPEVLAGDIQTFFRKLR
ncbi:hypothetical protein [Fontibacillus sp. BL9]